jgi:lipopolysaccharide/colanic/teichoic acid biosynthesis glycosyltransferase
MMSTSSASAPNPSTAYYAWEEVERDLDVQEVSFWLALSMSAVDTPLEGGVHPYDERELSASLDLFQRRQQAYHDSIDEGLDELRDVIAEVQPRRAKALSLLTSKAGALLSETRGPNYGLKRLIDILFGVVGIVLLAPLLLVIAIAIKLDSRGPVLYRAVRLGPENLPFGVLRFRTMRTNVDPQVPLFTAGDDPRLTRVGRFLRRSALNELPQLFNVLRGDMTLIGPRPLPPLPHGFTSTERGPEVDEYLLSQWLTVRCLLKPGLTGPWVLHEAGPETLIDWASIDIEYFRKWSVGLDFKILAKSVSYAFRPQH